MRFSNFWIKKKDLAWCFSTFFKKTDLAWFGLIKPDAHPENDITSNILRFIIKTILHSKKRSSVNNKICFKYGKYVIRY